MHFVTICNVRAWNISSATRIFGVYFIRHMAPMSLSHSWIFNCNWSALRFELIFIITRIYSFTGKNHINLPVEKALCHVLIDFIDAHTNPWGMIDISKSYWAETPWQTGTNELYKNILLHSVVIQISFQYFSISNVFNHSDRLWISFFCADFSEIECFVIPDFIRFKSLALKCNFQ